MALNIQEAPLDRRKFLGLSAAVGFVGLSGLGEAKAETSSTSLDTILIPEDEIGQNRTNVVAMQYVTEKGRVTMQFALRKDARVLTSHIDPNTGEFTPFEATSPFPISDSIESFKKLSFAVANKGKTMLLSGRVDPDDNQTFEPATFLSFNGGESFEYADQFPVGTVIVESKVIPDGRILLHEFNGDNHRYSFLNPKTGEYTVLEGKNSFRDIAFIRDVFTLPDDDDRLVVLGPAPQANILETESIGWQVTEIDLKSGSVVNSQHYESGIQSIDDVKRDPVTGLIYVSHAESGRILRYRLNEESGQYEQQDEMSYNNFFQEPLEADYGPDTIAQFINIEVYDGIVWGAGWHKINHSDGPTHPLIAAIDMEQGGDAQYIGFGSPENVDYVADQIQLLKFKNTNGKSLPRVTAVIQARGENVGIGPVAFPTNGKFRPKDLTNHEYPSRGLSVKDQNETTNA